MQGIRRATTTQGGCDGDQRGARAQGNAPNDREPGGPQARLTGEEPDPSQAQDRTEGDVGAPQEGGADSAVDAAREGG